MWARRQGSRYFSPSQPRCYQYFEGAAGTTQTCVSGGGGLGGRGGGGRGRGRLQAERGRKGKVQAAKGVGGEEG